jgi:uncharacterized membrane protein YvbJ
MESVCPFCASELSPGVRKCRHCGEWLPGQGGGATPRDELAGTVNQYLRMAPKVIAIYAIVSLMIFAIAAVFMFRWFNSESNQMQEDHDQRVEEMRTRQPR